MSRRWWIAVAVAFSCSLTACSNPFKDTYTSTLERWPHGEVSRLLPPEGEPEIVSSEDMRRDATRLMEDGYLLLGRSKFRTTGVDPKAAREQAKEIGATVVLVGEEYAQSVTECVPMTDWIPDREVTTRETTIIESGPEAGTVIERDVVHTIKGEFRTSCVPQTTDYYDYAATFWGKSREPIFGVLVEELTAAARERIQSNHGVEVRAVIRNSPAFVADILSGDIITSFAGQTILDPDQFFDLVLAHAGQPVTIEVNRNGQVKTFEVPLKTA